MWNNAQIHRFVKEQFQDRFLVVVSNREPYVHYRSNGKVAWERGGGGLAAVLDPAMQTVGGVWVAWGSGDADWEVTDHEGKVAVPPHKPSYLLKRVRLTQKEIEHYYYGLSNRFFWPLFHKIIDRVHFLEEEWGYYKEANFRFANAVLAEIREKRSPVIWIQDYHLACVPLIIRERRPDATLSLFWHIPWPSYDIFRLAPCRRELLKSLLCCNLIGFQTDSDRDHFLESVQKEFDFPVDFSSHAVTYRNHTTVAKTFPASVDTEAWIRMASRPGVDEEVVNVRKRLGLRPTGWVGIGVDRLEYTKGILERFLAMDLFLKRCPEFHGKFTFLQVASPSRTAMSEYREYGKRVENVVCDINKRYGSNGWKPIDYRPCHLNPEDLAVYYRAADIAVVSPFADGMNLVAKEFVASQIDGKGVLLLSEFAGAAREMKGAVLIDPSNIEGFAEGIKRSLEMPLSLKQAKMRDMLAYLKTNNVYKWVGEQLLESSQIDPLLSRGRIKPQSVVLR